MLPRLALVLFALGCDEPPPAAAVEAPSAQAGPSHDPLRPAIELTLGGACSTLRFEGTMRVTTNPGGAIPLLAVNALEDDALLGALVVQGEPELGRPIAIGPSAPITFQLSAGGANGWYSVVPGASGTLTFSAWTPAAGLLDVRIEDAVLVHLSNGSTCTASGRVLTRGVTMGDR